MKCIACHPPSICVLTEKKNKHHFSLAKSIWLPSREATRLPHKWNRLDSLATRAATPAIFLAATSPPNSGDLSVLFQTSAVMLLAYWIANFVVPEFVLKDLHEDKANEETKQDEQNQSDNGEGDSTVRRASSSGTKKRGFDGSKR